MSYSDYTLGYWATMDKREDANDTRDYDMGRSDCIGGCKGLTETEFRAVRNTQNKPKHKFPIGSLVVVVNTASEPVPFGQVGVVNSHNVIDGSNNVKFDMESDVTHRMLNHELKTVETEPRVIYISGPMTGIPENNYPLFHATARKLRADGHRVYNPAEFWSGPPEDFPIRQAFAAYCNFICLEATEIYLLPGFENSRGAMAELALAGNCGLKVVLHDND